MHWVGTWSAAQQLTESLDLPPPPGLAGSTLRQIASVSLGGSHLRVKFSNEYGEAPLVVRAARVANAIGGSSIDPESDRGLTFEGRSSAIVAAGAELCSDPLEYSLAPLSKLAVSVALESTPEALTGHPGSRTTSYLQAGDASCSSALRVPSTAEHWYLLAAIDVLAESSSSAVVAFGDSITDGHGSTTDGSDRWPDALARRLRANAATCGTAVLNQGVGGNAVLGGGLGPPGRTRFRRDALEPRGVRWVIVLEGVNDIGASQDASVVGDLIGAYRGFAEAARSRGIRIYGAPILPFGASQYDSAEHETSRLAVNDFIRTSNLFDGVIDFDAAVRDPRRPSHLLSAYDCGDHLHLNAAGYRAMAEAIDLTLFTN